QALEADGARRLWNELFFSAPQLKRDSLCCPPPTANYLWNTTAPTSADSGSEFQPSRGVVTCQDPSDVPPGASSYGRLRGIREGLVWPRCRTGPVGVRCGAPAA